MVLRRYDINQLLACIAAMEPILASQVQQVLEERLVFLGEPLDPAACEWWGGGEKGCNFSAILDILTEITDVGHLQRLEACAAIISALDDDDSSSSSTPDDTSSTSSTSESRGGVACELYSIRTPQYHETETSTSTIIMDVLAGHVEWEVVTLEGSLNVQFISVTGGPGTLSKNQNTGEITYIPNPDGSEAGTLVYIQVRYTDSVTGCTADVYLHLIITEETSTD